MKTLTLRSARKDVRLTPRETEVLSLVGRGMTSAEVAGCLYISSRTVDYHLLNVYGKLEVSNRISALLAARRRGMIPPVTAVSSLVP